MEERGAPFPFPQGHGQQCIGNGTLYCRIYAPSKNALCRKIILEQ